MTSHSSQFRFSDRRRRHASRVLLKTLARIFSFVCRLSQSLSLSQKMSTPTSLSSTAVTAAAATAAAADGKNSREPTPPPANQLHHPTKPDNPVDIERSKPGRSYSVNSRWIPPCDKSSANNNSVIAVSINKRKAEFGKVVRKNIKLSDDKSICRAPPLTLTPAAC